MSRVTGHNTKPEIIVRRLLHRTGYRFRLHDKKLPGNPDIVLPRYKKIVLVHGCFWHCHTCKRAKRPTTNVDFWNKKLDETIKRDRKNRRDLRQLGWKVLVVWQCQTQDIQKLQKRLRAFMIPGH